MYLGVEITTEQLSNEVGDSVGYLAIPAGWYHARIEEADQADTAKGTGKYIKIRFVISSGDYENRTLFCYINYRNDNPVAQAIGSELLLSLMQVLGIAKLSDPDQFLGRECQIKVAKKKDDEYGDTEGWKNVVKKFKPIGDDVAPQQRPSNPGRGSNVKRDTAPSHQKPPQPQQPPRADDAKRDTATSHQKLPQSTQRSRPPFVAPQSPDRGASPTGDEIVDDFVDVPF